MSEATLQHEGQIRVSDGVVRVRVFDKLSADHVFQHLWRQAVRAKKARVVDSTSAASFPLREHILNPGA